jgi:hypothetical protein
VTLREKIVWVGAMASRELTAKQVSLWKKAREVGPARFIILKGGFGGGSAGLVSILISDLLNHKPVTWTNLGFMIVTMPLLGMAAAGMFGGDPRRPMSARLAVKTLDQPTMMRIDYQRITEEAYDGRKGTSQARMDRLTYAGALVVIIVPLLVFSSAFLIYPWVDWVNMAHSIALWLWGD